MQILGSNKKQRIGTKALCLSGNPVKVADYHSLENEFKYLYFVKVKNDPVAGKYWTVVGEVRG